jgi:trehalose 6-phosphate synthase/phosphatase
MNRILIVANRLPVSVVRRDGAFQFERSVGGLASGLAGIHERSGGLWVGWVGGDGHPLGPVEQAVVAEGCRARRLSPVFLSAPEVQGFYEQFCNGVLWPVLHDLVGNLPLQLPDLQPYEAVNRRFADAVVAQHRPGDLVWIHDYQLMLVPALVRARLPEARIAFFLHVPFPAPDLFRVLPFRDKLLQGLLGADLIGFHTAAYQRHFAASALRTLGAPLELDQMRWQGRSVRVGVFPMGVDAEELDRLARTVEVAERVESLRQGQPPGLKTLVGVDRLDYSKGIPRRLLAFEALLLRHPELRGRVRLLQVAVPSRTGVPCYRDFRDKVDTLVGRVNGAFATATWTPVHYIFRNLPLEEVVALYRIADALLVTPLRDGMNLVAKEFVASRIDDDGVLVLSEFAGAASELAEALPVNPYDVEGTAEAFHRALSMPTDERQSRMRALRRRVQSCDVARWSGLNLEALSQTQGVRPLHAAACDDRAIGQLVARARRARPLALIMDYDGTLVPFARTPALAWPDDEAITLLQALARRPHTHLHVVSGRSRDGLLSWLGHLPVHLHAEHGLWSRAPGAAGRAEPIPAQGWRGRLLDILRLYAERTPGSLVEEKPAGLAWHYRAADPEYGAQQANELRSHLQEVLSNAAVEILAGDKVIEVRPHGVHKGSVVPRILAQHPGAFLLAIGDDQTDEDLFAALPPGAASVGVGTRESRADYRLADVAAVRALLAAIADEDAAEVGFSAA